MAVVVLGMLLNKDYQAVALCPRPLALANKTRVVASDVPDNLLHVLLGVDGDI